MIEVKWLTNTKLTEKQLSTIHIRINSTAKELTLEKGG